MTRPSSRALVFLFIYLFFAALFFLLFLGLLAQYHVIRIYSNQSVILSTLLFVELPGTITCMLCRINVVHARSPLPVFFTNLAIYTLLLSAVVFFALRTRASTKA